MDTLLTLPARMRISAPVMPGYAHVLTPDALAFVARIHREIEPRRQKTPSIVGADACAAGVAARLRASHRGVP